MVRKIFILNLFFLFLFAQEGGRYLIITPDTFYHPIKPLADWKHQKGMMVKVAKLSEIGNTPSQIKNYIVNAYNNFNPRPEYLLLVGSPEFLPSYYYQSLGIYSDNYYADVTGDYRAEMAYGRLPARSPYQCSVMVAKILHYEKNPIISDSFYIVKGAGIVREDYDPPDDSIYWSDIRFACQMMGNASFIHCDTFSRAQGDNADSVILALNDGRSLLIYRGSGVGNWYSPFNINPSLVNNPFKLPVIGSFTCQTLTLAPNESMVGERWLRVGTLNSLKGAVAFIGNTHSGTNIAPIRSAAMRGFIRCYFSDSFHLGKALLSAKESIYARFNNQAEYLGFNLLGDPELNILTGIPQPLIVEFPETISIGSQTVSIQVSRQNNPVRNALVCLLKEGEVYTYGYTNEQGEVNLAINPQTPGEILLTITSKNSLPFEDTIYCVIRDVGTTEILEPIGDIPIGTTITPRASFKNFGTTPENFYAFFKIVYNGNSIYKDSVFLSLSPGEEEMVSFTQFTISEIGNYLTYAWTELTDDINPDNDTVSSSFAGIFYDISMSKILAPVGILLPGERVIPQAEVKNYGNRDALFNCVFDIYKGRELVYSDTLFNVILGTGLTDTLDFDFYTVERGSFTIKVFTIYASDMNPSNDTTCSWFGGGVIGWSRLADAAVGTKPVKDGGALAYVGENKILALKGNNTNDVIEYDIITNSWSAKTMVPEGPKGKKVKKGGAICWDGSEWVYVLKGGNTREFYRYNLKRENWEALPDIPSSKGVKGGGALTFFDGKVYALPGGKLTECYAYDTTTRTWSPDLNPPAGADGKGFGDGSALTNDGERIYALQGGGKVNEFFIYKPDSGWAKKPDLPLTSSTGKKKKVKMGGALAYVDGYVYALKGGNTCEFYGYETANETWRPLEDMPLGSKKVKGGGALTVAEGFIYAFKGNNTNEFYVYVSATFFSIPKLTNLKAQLNMGEIEEFKLTISPNPIKNYIPISYSLPVKTSASLMIYDILGNLVYQARTNKEALTIDTKRLGTGIYILKFNAGKFKVTRKIIITR